MTSKRVTVLSAALACLCFGGEAYAEGECSNATLRGAYGFSVHGQLLGLLDTQGLHPYTTASIIDGVALQKFDGAGHFARTDFLTVNGAPRAAQTAFNPNQTGTYTVNADCTGSMHMVYNSGAVLDAQIVVADEGKIVKGILSAETVPSSEPAADGTQCSANCVLGVQVSLDGRKVEGR
ncbi:hypothetical protein FSO04_41660 [Paraburkholderia madseniana]|uniref:Uncharacterized protein n=1 Tax=Paraburkholderia madseniana TaxID=2599607 RepID=A0A6N6W2I2_9BURK|nr:hypothetical protein [Paraburkholderia madseniana]KAE8754078.1 hypothetical protein FSO04_41660 [Paraburkholderia madseniana]